MPFELIDLRDCPKKPWKNGAGLMRELASHPASTGYENFDWKISVAEMSSDSPFSSFPGIDRCIALLHGAGIRLTFIDDGSERDLDTLLQPFRFLGEERICAKPIDGPCENLAVLVQRGRYCEQFELVDTDRTLGPGGAAFVLCVDGEATVETKIDGTHRLHKGQSALWREVISSIRISLATAEARAIVVRFRRVTAAA